MRKIYFKVVKMVPDHFGVVERESVNGMLAEWNVVKYPKGATVRTRIPHSKIFIFAKRLHAEKFLQEHCHSCNAAILRVNAKNARPLKKMPNFYRTECFSYFWQYGKMDTEITEETPLGTYVADEVTVLD